MTRVVTIGALALVFLAPSSALAQNVESGRRHVQRELSETQRDMREGAVVKANVRVTVRLNNGSRLKGVVKNGRFIERIDGREFVRVAERGPDAGLRIWYSGGTNSYMFLPYTSVRNYKIGKKLTDAEVAEIAAEIESARLAAEAKRREQAEAKKLAAAKLEQAALEASEADQQREQAVDKDGIPIPAKPAVEQEPTSMLTEEHRALLQEFPPEAGWGLDKLRTLETRKVTVRVFPNDHEQKFMDNFSKWNEAFEIFELETERKTEPVKANPRKETKGTPASRPSKR